MMVKRFFSKVVLILVLVFLGACAGDGSTDVVSSADIIGAAVKNQDGKVVGTVEEVIGELESGRIRYLIIEFAPDNFSYTKAAFVPNAENRAAVPLGAIERDGGSADFVLTVDESVLDEAPRFTVGLDALSEGWDAGIRAYWREELN